MWAILDIASGLIKLANVLMQEWGRAQDRKAGRTEAEKEAYEQTLKDLAKIKRAIANLKSDASSVHNDPDDRAGTTLLRV